MASQSGKRGQQHLFGAYQNVVHLIGEFGSHFDRIVVSTWRDQLSEREAARLRSLRTGAVDVLELADPGAGHDWYGPLADNRLRQFTSTYAALKTIQSRADPHDLFLKVRSDQWLPLNTLLRELKVEMDADASRLFFPFALRTDTFSVGDFFLGGQVVVGSAFFESLVNERRIFTGSRSVHADLAVRYLLFRYRTGGCEYNPLHVLAGQFAARGAQIPVETAHLLDWFHQLNEHFALSSDSWLSTSTWRGVPMTQYSNIMCSPDTGDYQRFSYAMRCAISRPVATRSILGRFLFSQYIFTRTPSAFRLTLLRLEYRMRQLLSRL